MSRLLRVTVLTLSSAAVAHALSSSSSSFSSSSSSREPTRESFDNETISLSCEVQGLYSVAVLGKQGVFCVAQQPCSGKQDKVTHFACPVAGQRDVTGATALVKGSCCAVLSSGVIGCASLDSATLSAQCLPPPDWFTPAAPISIESPVATTVPATAAPAVEPDATSRVTRVLEPTPTPALVNPVPTTSASSIPSPPTQSPAPVTSRNGDPDAGDPTPQPSTAAPATPSPSPVTPSPTPTPTLAPTPLSTPTPTPSTTQPPSPVPTPNQGSQGSGSSWNDVGGRGSTSGSTVGAPVGSDTDAGFAPAATATATATAALEREDQAKNDFATMAPIVDDLQSATSRPTVHRFSDPAATSQPTSSSSSLTASSINDNALVFIVVGAVASIAVIIGAAMLRRGAPDRSTASLQEFETGTPRVARAGGADAIYGASTTPRDTDEAM